MSDAGVRFVDQSGVKAAALDLWPAVIIPKEQIDAQIERLVHLPAPPNGRRSAWIVHPRAEAPGLGLAPGIRVSLDVLKPGEQTQPIRHNSTQVSFCIYGSGYAVVGGTRIGFQQYDVWNTPSMHTYWHANDGTALQVRLTYSNSALLEKMNVHVVEEDPPEAGASQVDERGDDDPARRSPYGTFRLTDAGAYLMPYEQLINPTPVESKPLHWPWQLVKVTPRQAGGAGHVVRRPPALSAFQPGDRAHQRHHAELLRHHHHPPAPHRRPAAPPHLGGDQLLLRRPRPQRRRGPDVRVEGR